MSPRKTRRLKGARSPKVKKKSEADSKALGWKRLRNLDPRWLYGALLLAAALLLFGSGGFRRLVSSTLLLRSMKAEHSALDQESRRLRREIDAARSDDRALESELRKMGFVGPNEIEYRFTPPKKGSE